MRGRRVPPAAGRESTGMSSLSNFPQSAPGPRTSAEQTGLVPDAPKSHGKVASVRVTHDPLSRLCVLVLQECTMKVQEGKFKLQDLLVVPMQRVLKYHLLLKVGPPTRE